MNVLRWFVALVRRNCASRSARRRRRSRRRPAKKPNILIIWGDDIGYWNVSAYNQGMMGYKTPNIDRIAKEGALFTDWYGQQSCTAGRAAFITGQSPFRTGLLKVGLPGAKEGLQARDVTHRRSAQGAGLHDRAVRQEPPRRSRRAPADRARLPGVQGLALSPECRGRAGARGLLQESRVAQAVRHARRDPHLGQPGRHAEDREHRPAQQEAHGDDRRRDHEGDDPLHGRREEGRQAVLPLVELDPHAHLDAAQGVLARQDRPRHLSRRHGRARRPGRRAPRRAQGTRPRREHHRDVLDRQRRGEVHLARRRHLALPRREEHQLGRRLPRADIHPLARRHQARHRAQRHLRARGHAADAARRGRRARRQGAADERA